LPITNYEVGQSIELIIESLSFNGGRGVGRHEGMVVFVPLTVPGDRILAKVEEVKKAFLVASLSEVLQPSHARKDARCSVFGRCGSCSWQNVEYEEQLKQKQKILVSALNPILKNHADIEMSEIVASPSQFGYRNRIQVHKSGNQVGFFARGSRKIVDIEVCPIAEPDVSAQIHLIRSQTDDRYEISRRTDEHVGYEAGTRSAEAALFSQVNSGQNANLIAAVLSAAAEAPFREAWDLYCGAGNLTLPLAQNFPKAKVLGVELSRQAIQRSKEIQSQVKWFAEDVGRFLRDQQIRTGLLVVLDPPRVGVEDRVIAEFIRLQPERILYVSCNPMTLSRDLQKILRSNYKLKKIQGFDMFPQTEHFEILAHLERR
jgi:23S rRNA (uracil1939-C5)-methyltransferase